MCVEANAGTRRSCSFRKSLAFTVVTTGGGGGTAAAEALPHKPEPSLEPIIGVLLSSFTLWFNPSWPFHRARFEPWRGELRAMVMVQTEFESNELLLLCVRVFTTSTAPFIEEFTIERKDIFVITIQRKDIFVIIKFLCFLCKILYNNQ